MAAKKDSSKKAKVRQFIVRLTWSPQVVDSSGTNEANVLTWYFWVLTGDQGKV